MMNSKRIADFFYSVFIAVFLFALAGCSPAPEVEKVLTAKDYEQLQSKLDAVLADPAERTRLIAKVLGTTVEGERHAYLKFHIYGYAGDGNLIPFFSFNNYVIQKWTPGENSTFDVTHYEAAYYTKFDTDEAINTWENPLTGEVVDIPHFVLGPLPRQYGPGLGESPATFAPDPLNITMIGDRVYIPTLTRIEYPPRMSTEEWGPYGNDTNSYWDSMLVFSADIQDVFDDEKTHVDADIHMQNFVSWAPYFKLGNSPGRTMARAYGQHISGYEALPERIRADFAKYTPEILDIEPWVIPRIDSIDLMKELMEKREAGTLDIDQEDYVPFTVKKFDEVVIE